MADMMQYLMLKQFTDHGAGSSVSSITETANALGTLLDRFSPQGQSEGTSITEKVVDKLLASMPAPQAQTPVQAGPSRHDQGTEGGRGDVLPAGRPGDAGPEPFLDEAAPPPGQSNTDLEMKRMDWDFKLKMQQMADDKAVQERHADGRPERTKILTDVVNEVTGRPRRSLGKGEVASLDQARSLRRGPQDRTLRRDRRCALQ